MSKANELFDEWLSTFPQDEQVRHLKATLAERDASIEAAFVNYGKACELVTKERERADKSEAIIRSLRWQIDHEGCAASREGETTYECRADQPCGLCRLRSERDEARRQLVDMFVTLRFAGDVTVARLRAEADARWPGNGMFPEART